MNPHRIFIVEDDAPMSRLLRISLELEGHNPIVALSREEALEKMGDESPELVIMDYVMGGMDPEVFLSKARAQGFVGRILLCSGLDGDYGLDVDDILMKPFDPAQLTERVSELLARPRATHRASS
jgi:DNA-binding response OmpR family regulator